MHSKRILNWKIKKNLFNKIGVQNGILPILITLYNTFKRIQSNG